MTRHLVGGFAAASLALALTACGGSSDKTSSSPAALSSTVAASSSSTSATTSSAAPSTSSSTAPSTSSAPTSKSSASPSKASSAAPSKTASPVAPKQSAAPMTKAVQAAPTTQRVCSDDGSMKLVAGPHVHCSFAEKVLAQYKATHANAFSVWSDSGHRMVRITASAADGASFTTDAGSYITWAPSGL